MLEDDFKYFKDNHDQLFADYPNMHLVIKDKKVICTGATFEEALQLAVSDGLEVGTFIIQLCSSGDGGYTQTFHSRVIFA